MHSRHDISHIIIHNIAQLHCISGLKSENKMITHRMSILEAVDQDKESDSTNEHQVFGDGDDSDAGTLSQASVGGEPDKKDQNHETLDPTQTETSETKEQKQNTDSIPAKVAEIVETVQTTKAITIIPKKKKTETTRLAQVKDIDSINEKKVAQALALRRSGAKTKIVLNKAEKDRLEDIVKTENVAKKAKDEVWESYVTPR